MRYLILCLITFMSLTQVACISWPIKGFGGMGEHHLQQNYPDQPIGPEDGLLFEMELLNRHLNMLVLEGAELCFPATVVQASLRQNRIARQIQGGLEFDATNDIIVQRKILQRLERQLNYVKQHDVCVLPVSKDHSSPGEIGNRIEGLLNGQHQFLSNSTELNPKYVAQLSEAAHLLRDNLTYRLRITGHVIKSQQSNITENLSIARAEKVARYLQILGLAAERIEVDAVSKQNSLFKGQQPQPASTRRVSIELIETLHASNAMPIHHKKEP